MWYMYIVGYYATLKKKKANPVICRNIDEHRKHYVKWNKPSTQIQMLHYLLYVWNLKSWIYRNIKYMLICWYYIET